MNIQETVHESFKHQLEVWPLCKSNFDALNAVKLKTFHINGCKVFVQFNPARIRSTGAKLTKESIAKRPCFLCAQNLPQEQIGIDWNNYRILTNPYPIFPEHFTIPCTRHTPQTIQGRMEDMLLLAKDLPDFVIFFNGARCGASAPDHMHFQAGTKSFLPIIEWNEYPTGEPICKVISSNLQEACSKAMEQIEDEEMVNIIAYYEGDNFTVIIINRSQFRPWQYTAEPDKQLLVSPATVEMGGVIITPIEEHFNRITESDLLDIYKQCYKSPK